MQIEEAKKCLDNVISKSRIHFYKPIQIAEILHKERTQSDNEIVLSKLETYRIKSRQWRDVICMQFLGRTSTSSAKFQDNLFEANAIPPIVLATLGIENKKKAGIVEAYIYKAFENKHLQLQNALEYCLNKNKNDFSLTEFFDQFWKQAGLKRSLDKLFEIVVYALFESLIQKIGIKIDIYYDNFNLEILKEFEDFCEKIVSLSTEKNRQTLDAHFYRVGVTNAADRGLDMFANFGSVIQIKHLSLDEELAENIVTSITANKIVIVCKEIERKTIVSLLSQIGWKNRIQAVITFEELEQWYEKALRGKYSNVLGNTILKLLSEEIKNEFPSVGNRDFNDFKEKRGYLKLPDEFWS